MMTSKGMAESDDVDREFEDRWSFSFLGVITWRIYGNEHLRVSVPSWRCGGVGDFWLCFTTGYEVMFMLLTGRTGSFFGLFDLIFGRIRNLILMVNFGLVRSSLVYVWFENP